MDKLRSSKTCEDKNRLYKIYKQNPTCTNEKNYRLKKNYTTNIIRQSKRAYFTKYFKTFMHDTKKTWQGINNALEQTKSKTLNLTSIKDINGILLANTEDTAAAFAHYFENIPHMTRNQIKTLFTQNEAH